MTPKYAVFFDEEASEFRIQTRHTARNTLVINGERAVQFFVDFETINELDRDIYIDKYM
jgi:hypothetical protein